MPKARMHNTGGEKKNTRRILNGKFVQGNTESQRGRESPYTCQMDPSTMTKRKKEAASWGCGGGKGRKIDGVGRKKGRSEKGGEGFNKAFAGVNFSRLTRSPKNSKSDTMLSNRKGASEKKPSRE